jgi:hypothetical protein
VPHGVGDLGAQQGGACPPEAHSIGHHVASPPCGDPGFSTASSTLVEDMHKKLIVSSQLTTDSDIRPTDTASARRRSRRRCGKLDRTTAVRPRHNASSTGCERHPGGRCGRCSGASATGVIWRSGGVALYRVCGTDARRLIPARRQGSFRAAGRRLPPHPGEEAAW